MQIDINKLKTIAIKKKHLKLQIVIKTDFISLKKTINPYTKASVSYKNIYNSKFTPIFIGNKLSNLKIDCTPKIFYDTF